MEFCCLDVLNCRVKLQISPEKASAVSRICASSINALLGEIIAHGIRVQSYVIFRIPIEFRHECTAFHHLSIAPTCKARACRPSACSRDRSLMPAEAVWHDKAMPKWTLCSLVLCLGPTARQDMESDLCQWTWRRLSRHELTLESASGL